MQSALGVDLTHNSAALPLHKGTFHGRTVWFVITEASDFGLAHGLSEPSPDRPTSARAGSSTPR